MAVGSLVLLLYNSVLLLCLLDACILHVDLVYVLGRALDLESDCEVSTAPRIFTLQEVVCLVCGGGHAESHLLLCDTCDTAGAHHTFCLNPPLAEVPAPHEPWHCPQCQAGR